MGLTYMVGTPRICFLCLKSVCVHKYAVYAYLYIHGYAYLIHHQSFTNFVLISCLLMYIHYLAGSHKDNVCQVHHVLDYIHPPPCSFSLTPPLPFFPSVFLISF